MDEYIFTEQINSLRTISEATTYLEILNHSDPASNTSKYRQASEDFENFINRNGIFRPPELPEGVTFTNGIRLVLTQRAEASETFKPNVISLWREDYEKMMRYFRLPLRAIETSSVVGPFFWWTYVVDDPTDPVIQLVFRKSDVSWNGVSRGWELVLSYSFRSNMTSGYVKGTKKANIESIMTQLRACATPVSHPLLLPVIMLTREISAENDVRQRLARDRIRGLENALDGRYSGPAAAGYTPAEDLTLDSIKRIIVECRSEILWKRPQAWQNAVRRTQEASNHFWENLSEDWKTLEMRKIHQSLMSRLDFMTTKLEGLENYAHISLERLDFLREELHNIIAQVESRVNIDIASQQHLLANASKRENSSMKTLAILGAVFLPGTFLSSMFSMPFFNFDSDMNGSVSRSLWIYFIMAVPLTILVVGVWFVMDRRIRPEVKEEPEVAETRLFEIEARVIERLRRMTRRRVRTMDRPQV